MEREIYVSTGMGIDVRSLSGERLRSAPLEESGALCLCGEQLFCAGDAGRVIYRLDRHTLMTHALFAGGPGICHLIASPDGERLYALCADADSVLLLDARGGQPMIVCRVGCNPRQMALEDDVLAIAGGESGCVHLFNAHTLREQGRFPMPGPVYAAAFGRGSLHALCLTQTLDSILVTIRRGGREEIALCGMPGCLLSKAHALLAATQGRLYAVSLDGGRMLSLRAAPGRAGQMIAAENRIVLADPLSEQLFVCAEEGGGWRRLCAGVQAAAEG